MKFEFSAEKFSAIKFFSKCGSFAEMVSDSPAFIHVNTIEEVDRLSSQGEEATTSPAPANHYERIEEALHAGEQVLCLLSEPLVEDRIRCADGNTYGLDFILNEDSPSIRDHTLHLLISIDETKMKLVIETCARDFGSCAGAPRLFEMELSPAFGKAIEKFLHQFVS